MIDTAQVLPAIYRAIDEFNAGRGEDGQLQLRPEEVLFGRGARLDSLGLVHLLVSVEQSLNDTFGVAITLASDRAMSMQRSPFRTVQSLADFATQLLNESSHGR